MVEPRCSHRMVSLESDLLDLEMMGWSSDSDGGGGGGGDGEGDSNDCDDEDADDGEYHGVPVQLSSVFDN